MHGAFTAAVDGVTYACREERRADQSAQVESIQNAANPRVIVPSRNLFSLIYHHGKLYHARLLLTIVFSLFQVISERAERATLIITTNLPFSERTKVFPSARL